MGAWIETMYEQRLQRIVEVASYMGAWIETLDSLASAGS